jgi:hypothetical protein
MPEGKIKSVFTGDADHLLREMSKIVDKTREYENHLKQTTEGHKTLAQAIADQTGKAKDAFQDKLKLLGMIAEKQRDEIELNTKLKMSYEQLGATIRHQASERNAMLADFGRLNDSGLAMMGRMRETDRWTALGAAGANTRDWLATQRPDPWFRGEIDKVIAGRGTSGGAGGGLDLRRHNDDLRETTSLMTSWGRSAMSVAASYIGIQEAISLAMQARQKQIELEDRANAGQRTYAEAMETIYKNVGSDDAAFGFVKRDMSQVARDYGVKDQQMLGLLYEYAISGAGGDAQRGAEIVRATAQANRFTLATQGTGYATGINALMKAVPGLSAVEASSMLQGLGEKSNIVQQAMMSEYIAPTGMAGIATSDLTKVSRLDVTREAMAGAATLASFALDNEGRTASTNWNLFSYETQKFFKEKGLPDPGSAMRRVDWLAANQPELLQDFESALGGDARLKPFVTLLAVRRDKEMREYYQDTLKEIDPKSGRHQKLAAKLPGLTPQNVVADVTNKIEAEDLLANINRTPEGILAAARKNYIAAQDEIFSQRRQRPGSSALSEFVGAGVANLDLYSSLTSDVSEIRARQASIRRQRVIPMYQGEGNDRQIESGLLDRLDKKFDELIKALEANTEAKANALGNALTGMGFPISRDQARRLVTP